MRQCGQSYKSRYSEVPYISSLRKTNRCLHWGHRRRNASQIAITRAHTKRGIKTTETDLCRRNSQPQREITTAEKQTLNSRALADGRGNGQAGVLARSDAAITRFNAVSGGTGSS